MAEEKRKEITPEEMREIKAIDTMCRPFYVSREHLKAMFTSFEFQTMAITTFGGVLRRVISGEKVEEAWEEMVAKGSSETIGEPSWQAMATMGPKESVKDVVAEMDEIGVEYICVDQMAEWSQRFQKIVDGWATIEQIAQWSKESGGRIIGGVDYNPLRIEESLKEVERAVKDYGFKYIWMHAGSYGLTPNDKRFYPLYAKCLELGIPVSMQTGQSAEPLPSEQMRPMHADEVAINFPGLTLILTHTGWPWVSEWISMLWRHPNVYGNIGAYMPSTLDPALVRFMDGPGRGKVLWATNGLGLTRCKKELLELPIRDATKKAVLHDNAIKVFKL